MTRNEKNQFFLYLGNSVLSLLYIAPLLWMVASAFKPERRIFADMTKGLIAFIPVNFTLENFIEVFSRSNLLRYIGNSIGYVTVLVLCSLVVNSMCGYALAKFHFKGKKLLFTAIIALFVLPLESIILALYWFVNAIGWNDTYIALIVPFIAKCFDIYLFRQFFLNVPDELIEAAAIDGANPVRTFFGLVVVQLGLQAFFTEPPVFYGPIMAALVISVIPMIIMFIFFQKYYVQGISATGIKG